MDPNLTSEQIRQMFIDFFVEKYNHLFVPSSSTVPHDDPTLLFANAGMNQFKPIYLGTVDPKSEMATYRRVVNSQKCIRAGGKHNDLDDVGKDTYHHTFFEMLGNWSFGDFFKKESIDWAWELLVDVYKMPAERMYVTYFGGDEKSGLQPDYETKNIWLAKGIAPERVLPFGLQDNFWEMGDTGPCGPCTEIHYDRIGGRDAAYLVNMDDPEVLEVWNLVFTQFNREADKSLRPLPRKYVDTGAGLERVTSVIQGVMSNYDTDLFKPLFDKIRSLTGAREYRGLLGDADVDGIDMAYRVLADHARTLTIAISDGGKPDSTGRGYVLRRILRRAVRYATEKLDAKPGMFAQLVNVAVEKLGGAFPEVTKDPQMVIDIINEEEAQFLKTLSRGRRMFEREVLKAKDGVLPGFVAWRLYDTYGFPVDLTHIMAEEKGLSIDMDGYEKAKQDSQELSRGKDTGVDDTVALGIHAIKDLEDLAIPLTDTSPKYNYESDGNGGYTIHGIAAKISALRYEKSFVNEVLTGSRCGIILDKSCFYAEQGGQIYDLGFIVNSDDEDTEFKVTDVQIMGGYVLHVGITEGTFKVGDTVQLQVDSERRRTVMNNHTATHILNFALREQLGEADQRGSLVAPDRLRFDFTAKGAMTTQQIKATEEIVGNIIEQKQQVFAKDATLAKASAIQGLRQVFAETYPDPVRIVSVGVSVDDLLEDPTGPSGLKTSVEFCGGTHLKNSGDMEAFVISSEEPIAKGIRRIIALTGSDAKKKVTKLQESLSELMKLGRADQTSLKAKKRQITELNDSIAAVTLQQWRKDELRETLKKVKKTIIDIEKAADSKRSQEVVEKAKEIASQSKDLSAVVEVLEAGLSSKVLDSALKQFHSIAPNTAAMLFSVDSEGRRVTCLCQVPEAIMKKGLSASDWVKSVMNVLEGKGGGKPTSAQGSGTNVAGLNNALNLAKEFAKMKLDS
ncbi:uncharacterized protein TRIADDRAFT_23916 [Trichoplax adhaerens]|uniref:Alanine--tRNA ligase n=1 Tax=Trichoplax adhaerens TaxID=10228 RepID=B3RVT0_TRIAD|nr:hypothetical protein TRIADDRAFT_23916 [Trichoplax adhaerens]EDV25551.1 hypothetical protein TRIADDRAFT_23916 [Trichoplax adhaerens]|eukprot:XP_002111584.1 hypothetical protein TRIADDRAFT_23916 [Trichoplax adhaerens]